MSRVYNFSAGPAVLPEEVLNEAAAEMLDYRGTGMSVMEMSHRSKSYETIIEDAESDLRDLLHIPENYKVLFLPGRRFYPVRHGSYEPDEESCGRLYHYRTVGKESTQRGIYLRKGKCHCFQC